MSIPEKNMKIIENGFHQISQSLDNCKFSEHELRFISRMSEAIKFATDKILAKIKNDK